MATVRRITTPKATTPFLVAGNQLEPTWFRFLVSLEQRRADNVATLSGSKTNDELRDAINEITAAMQNADLMETT